MAHCREQLNKAVAGVSGAKQVVVATLRQSDIEQVCPIGAVETIERCWRLSGSHERCCRPYQRKREKRLLSATAWRIPDQ